MRTGAAKKGRRPPRRMPLRRLSAPAICGSGVGRYDPSARVARSGWQSLSDCQKKCPGPARQPGHGQTEKPPPDQLRPGLASLFPYTQSARKRRGSNTPREQRTKTSAKVVAWCPPRRTRRLPSGSELGERDSITMRLSPVRLVKADGIFVKRRVHVWPNFHAGNSRFRGIWPRRRHSAA
jgi:hypothetical protein